jgi:peptidoglycan L-alanyl-D-glutamate endopeptidase CwlK
MTPRMTLGQHQEAFTRDLTKLLVYAHNNGYGVRMGEVYRTVEQQQLYIRTGRSKTMNSMHLKKCAADLHFTKDGELVYPEEIGRYWEGLNPLNQAGMFWKSFKDSPHFQRTV